MTALLKPGSSPHTYEPTPQDSLLVASCRLVFSVGLGLDDWVDAVVKAAGPHGPKVVKLGDALPQDELIAGDPHVWLDPAMAAEMVQHLAKALAAADPSHASDYAARAADYTATLEDLARECEELGEKFRGRKVVTYHRAFAYLFRRCGLQLLGVIEPQPGKSATTSHLAELAENMRATGVRVVFAEPQFSRKTADALARETAARVVLLDPLGDPDDPQRDTYVDLIRYNLRQIASALSAAAGQ